MSERRCKGCGSILQFEYPDRLGYAVREDNEYCQRCFKMIHYDQHVAVDVTAMSDLSKLNEVEGQFVWIMDVIDLETSLTSSFVDFFRQRSCYIVANKCDLLPKTYSLDKLADYITSRLAAKKVNVKRIFARGRGNGFADEFSKHFADIKENLIMVGIANVGKSTVINDLLHQDLLTVNRHPSTTLDFNYIEYQGRYIVDTVGLVDGGSIQAALADKDLKRVVPDSLIRPTVFQLTGNQTLSVGGLAKIDLKGCEKVTAVCYLSNLTDVVRNNYDHSEEFWQKHYGKDLLPVTQGSRYSDFSSTTFKSYRQKRDICIEGLGWLAISGKYDSITVSCDRRIKVRNRKAMI